MKGSLLLTFDELNDGSNSSNVDVFVNSQLRYRLYLDSTNLYSTYVDIGDSVTITMNNYIEGIAINIYRKDFTTDDVAGDNGIKITTITGTTGTTGTVTFTVSKLDSSYGYQYNINFVNISLTPTPTPSITPSVTPTKTPTPTPTITHTPTVTPTQSPTPPLIVYDGEYVLAALNNQKLYLSKDYGLTFNSTINSSSYNFNGACLSYNANYMFATSYLKIYRSTNYGSSWDVVLDIPDTAIGELIIGIDCDNNGKNVLAAGLYRCFKSDDYGVNWTVISGGTGTYQYGSTYVPAVNSYPQYAFPYDSSRYIKQVATSGSTSLSNFTNLGQDTWREFAISDDMKYYLTTQDDGLLSGQTYLSIDSGNTFSFVSSLGSSLAQPEIAMSSDGKYMYLTTDSGLLYSSSDYGSTWSSYNLGSNATDVECSSNGRLIYVSIGPPALGRIIYSWDYGTNWYSTDIAAHNALFVRCNRNKNYSPQITPTPTPTITSSPSQTPTNTPTPSVTPTFTPTNTLTPTVSSSPTSTNTPTPSVTSTGTPTPTVTPTVTPSQFSQVVTSGLTFYLDAANSASYPTTGTTWFDLTTADRDYTLINGPVFNSGTDANFQFDGTNDYATGFTMDFDMSGKTVEIWFKMNNQTTTWGSIYGQKDSGGYLMATYLTGGNRYLALTGQFDTPFGVLTGTTALNNATWYMGTITYSGSEVKIYVNANLDKTYSQSGNFTSQQTYIGGTNVFGEWFKGYISVVRAYNRVLSSTEILQNYNSQKSRYGY